MIASFSFIVFLILLYACKQLWKQSWTRDLTLVIANYLWECSCDRLEDSDHVNNSFITSFLASTARQYPIQLSVRLVPNGECWLSTSFGTWSTVALSSVANYHRGGLCNGWRPQPHTVISKPPVESSIEISAALVE